MCYKRSKLTSKEKRWEESDTNFMWFTNNVLATSTLIVERNIVIEGVNRVRGRLIYGTCVLGLTQTSPT